MTTIDRALRTLLRMRSAAPPAAANRITEVINLLEHLSSENEFLNAQHSESFHSPSDYGVSSRNANERGEPSSFDNLFGDQFGSDRNLLGDFDLSLFTDEMPAVSLTNTPVNYLTHLDTLTTERVTPDKTEYPNPDEMLTQLDAVLRPSLASLQEQASALFDSRLGRLTSNQSDALRLMLSNSTSIVTMLDSLELLQQLRRHTLKMRPAIFNPIDLLDAVQQRVTESASAHDHQLTIQGDNALPMVNADYDRTLVIFTDIVDNAIHYTPPDSSIRISADNLGSHVLFTISDMGIGLSPDEIERVGEPFWRALHQPLVQQQPGIGLRLFLARQILALQDGEMFFSGEPGFGSSFSFTVPTAQAGS